ATEVGKGRYSEPLLSSIDWMLNLAAKDRPQSVEAVLERLLGRTAAQPAATPTPPSKSTETAPPPTATPPQPKKSSAWPLGIGVLVLALLGMGSWAYLNGQNKTEVQPTAPTTTTISPPATTAQSTSGTAQTDPQPSPPQKTPDPTVATANPQPVEPPPALVGHLQINVNVADANIRLDGQPVGTASPGNPLNLEGLQLGPHRIEVEAAGYQPLSQPTQVEAQQWTQLALQLEPEITMGELIVRSNVSGDTVYIDGNAVGPTGKTPHRLAEGGYTIRVEKKGYKTYEQHVTVISGKQDTLRARLVSDRQPYEPKMVPIPGGSFEMGSPAWEEGRDNDEHLHRVSISSFKLAKTETTRTQWFSVMNDDSPGYAPCDTCPIINVSWKDVQSYISKLNQRTGKLYRLPTEAEWEYACRGGRSADLYCGGNSIDQLAFYAQNSGTWSDEVGQKQPNGYGLYDMSGNVWEWTCSAYDKDYGGGEQRCARQSSDANRSVRGGAFHNRPNMMRSAKRGGFQPAERDYDLGFRLAQD
ncbi:MAG: SUMF1/EgtB/PvdO family nonheme iron enzyme, partial [Candidatus Thiodiazotropha taylori]